MYEERDAEPQDHIAIKLSFFRSIDAEVLRQIKRRLNRNPDNFSDLLKELKGQDSLFTFYRSIGDRNERERIDDFEVWGEAIKDELLRYDKDGKGGVAVPRSTEFLKFVRWNEVRDKFQTAPSAIEYIKWEITKLLPLFYFLTS